MEQVLKVSTDHLYLTPLAFYTGDTPFMNVLSFCLTTLVEEGQTHFCYKTMQCSFYSSKSWLGGLGPYIEETLRFC